ncbi:MAG: hypothetical protein AAGC64_07495 [Bacteroidota bacterium]
MFFQGSKGVPGPSSIGAFGRSTDFSFFHLLSDIPFALVIVQRSGRIVNQDYSPGLFTRNSGEL